jgi:Fe2+ transport system protein B
VVVLLRKTINPLMSCSLRVVVWYRIIHSVLHEMNMVVLTLVTFSLLCYICTVVRFWHGKIYHSWFGQKLGKVIFGF